MVLLRVLFEKVDKGRFLKGSCRKRENHFKRKEKTPNPVHRSFLIITGPFPYGGPFKKLISHENSHP